MTPEQEGRSSAQAKPRYPVLLHPSHPSPPCHITQEVCFLSSLNQNLQPDPSPSLYPQPMQSSLTAIGPTHSPRSMSVKPSAAMASAVFLSMLSRHRLASCGSSKSRA